MRCPRCSGYLINDVHYEQGLDAGTYQDRFIRCFNCGLYQWRPRLQVVIRISEVLERHHVGQACKVEGCGNQAFSRGKSGFCQRCGDALRNWERGQARGVKSSPQPIVITPQGAWVKNPESLTWRRRQDGYTSQRDAGGIRTCRRCGESKFIRRDGLCEKCLHATREPSPCIQCGNSRLLSKQGVCEECAAHNMVTNWLKAGERNKYLRGVSGETDQERYDRLLATARSTVRSKRANPARPRVL